MKNKDTQVKIWAEGGVRICKDCWRNLVGLCSGFGLYTSKQKKTRRDVGVWQSVKKGGEIRH